MDNVALWRIFNRTASPKEKKMESRLSIPGLRRQ
ncbi:hypothetical protein LEMLEM_LOCUS16867, partial [Lemmus lemmus]